MNTYWIWILGIALISVALLQRQLRSQKYRSVAGKLGLRFEGGRLPEDLPISTAPFYALTDQVSNVLSGRLDSRETVVFDFHANHGDVGYKQSMVAVRSECRIPTMTALWRASEIQCLRLGGWVVMYRERVEVPARNISDFMSECSEMMRFIEAAQSEL